MGEEGTGEMSSRQRTTNQMFGKLQRDLVAAAHAEQQRLNDRARIAVEAEARLDQPMTRRELMTAIESVAHEYGMQGDHDSDLICNAFRKLGEALS